MTTDTTEAGARKTSSPFPIWKTVTVGKHRSGTAIIRSLEEHGHLVSECAYHILVYRRVVTLETEMVFDLVLCSAADLGFTAYALLSDICVRAAEHGLDSCPPEVGPEAREQYEEQCFGDEVVVAMEPLLDGDQDPSVWHLSRDEKGSLLNTAWYVDRARFKPATVFIFVLRRQVSAT